MNKELAKRICDIIDRSSGELDESVRWVKEECSEEEYLDYRRAITKILMDMLIEISTPIYRLYPDLIPKGLDVPNCSQSCKILNKVGFGNAHKEVKK